MNVAPDSGSDGGVSIDPRRVAAAAGLLLEARVSGRTLPALPQQDRPANEAEAYAVQDAVMAALGVSSVFKVGAKGGVGPKTSAQIPQQLVRRSPARFSLSQFGSCTLEVEIAYQLGRDLPPRVQPYAVDEVRDAIGSIVPAIEIADSRFHDYRQVDRFSQLADNQNCGAFIMGEAVADWRAIDPHAIAACLQVDGATIADTIGGHKMGDPFPLVHWFANQQSRRGRTTVAGTVITTGSFVGSIPWHRPASIVAILQGLGRIEAVVA